MFAVDKELKEQGASNQANMFIANSGSIVTKRIPAIEQVWVIKSYTLQLQKALTTVCQLCECSKTSSCWQWCLNCLLTIQY